MTNKNIIRMNREKWDEKGDLWSDIKIANSEYFSGFFFIG